MRKWWTAMELTLSFTVMLTTESQTAVLPGVSQYITWPSLYCSVSNLPRYIGFSKSNKPVLISFCSSTTMLNKYDTECFRKAYIVNSMGLSGQLS